MMTQSSCCGCWSLRNSVSSDLWDTRVENRQTNRHKWSYYSRSLPKRSCCDVAAVAGCWGCRRGEAGVWTENFTDPGGHHCNPEELRVPGLTSINPGLRRHLLNSLTHGFKISTWIDPALIRSLRLCQNSFLVCFWGHIWLLLARRNQNRTALTHSNTGDLITFIQWYCHRGRTIATLDPYLDEIITLHL